MSEGKWDKAAVAKHFGHRERKIFGEQVGDEQDVLSFLRQRILDWEQSKPFSEESREIQTDILWYLRNQAPKKLDETYDVYERLAERD